ncbi:MAG: Hsp70 family protein [Spirochaetaceae bacterium]|jgi:molecular chaperone DnaK|nr:Hsp70 family protein [Spirochaetaceae bacterium]
MSKIVGIDLGTSTSEIACIVKGAPKLIPNSQGKLITPSVVHIGEDGTILVGEEAAEYLFTRPDCTFMEVKRLTGSGGKLSAHGKEYAPEEIQAMLLAYLVRCAESHLKEKIDRAVITVPAYFTDVQRRATARAGELAGLQVERIINEPTAAALDYGLSNLKECKNVLVYDLGGGTLDVTVLELFEGVIDVKASSGNNHLGGKDFDEIIMGRLADAGGDERALMRLKKAAEDCKIALSTRDEYKVSLPFLLTDAGGKPVSVEQIVSRRDFEEWVSEKVNSTRTPMMSALDDAKLLPGELQVILLVGGSTRIPCVKKLVEEALGAVPRSPVDPDLTVARGAAIQAGLIEGSINSEDLVLTDVCPYTLGTAPLRDGLFGKRQVFDPLIPRNTTIPTEKAKIYGTVGDYQTEVIVDVYQGESSDPDNNERLGEVHLTGIPPARRGKEQIEVTFSYDMNGILQVKGCVVSTGKQVSSEINTTGVKAKPPLDISAWERAEGARQFRPLLRKAEKLIASGQDPEGDLSLLVHRIKEALVLKNKEQAEELRDELLVFLELLEKLDKLERRL